MGLCLFDGSKITDYFELAKKIKGVLTIYHIDGIIIGVFFFFF